MLQVARSTVLLTGLNVSKDRMASYFLDCRSPGFVRVPIPSLIYVFVQNFNHQGTCKQPPDIVSHPFFGLLQTCDCLRLGAETQPSDTPLPHFRNAPLILLLQKGRLLAGDVSTGGTCLGHCRFYSLFPSLPYCPMFSAHRAQL